MPHVLVIGGGNAALCAALMAAEAGAQVLFVHHGLLWGRPRSVTGTLYERLKLALEAFQRHFRPAKVDGAAIDYDTWPLLDNPWMHQDWDGNLRISDGVTERLYDFTAWKITERPVAKEAGK